MTRVLVALFALTIAAAAPAAAQTRVNATGKSFIAWDQEDVADVAEAQARVFTLYVDGERISMPLAHKCGPPAAGDVLVKATCAAPFPAVTPGDHRLELTAGVVVDGVTIEGARSLPLDIKLHVAPAPPGRLRIERSTN